MQEFGWGILGSQEEGGALGVPLWPYLGPPRPPKWGSCPQGQGKYKKRKVHQSTCPAPGDPRWRGTGGSGWAGTAPGGSPAAPAPRPRQRHGVCSAFGRFGGHCWGPVGHGGGGQAPGTRTLGQSIPFAPLSAPCKTNLSPHPERGTGSLSCSNGGSHSPSPVPCGTM